MLLLAACAAPSPDPGDPPPTGDFDAPFTDAAGLTGDTRMIVPDDVATGEPYGVLFFFTWDGGGPLYSEEADLHAELAAAHRLILVSMANPDEPPDNACWWTPEVEEYARYVDQFLQERVLAPYGADPQRVFLTGLSGGSDFAAAFHYHTGWAYGGGSAALCGGDVPRLDGGDCELEDDPPAAPAPDALDPATLDAVRYYYALARDDELWDYSVASATFYEDAGFTHVRHDEAAGSGHCGFDDGWEGLGELATGLDYLDPLTNP